MTELAYRGRMHTGQPAVVPAARARPGGATPWWHFWLGPDRTKTSGAVYAASPPDTGSDVGPPAAAGLHGRDGSKQDIRLPDGGRRPDSTPDETVLQAVAAGDRTALRLLYERHAPWLALRLDRRAASRELSEEALQDTFVAVWRQAGRYRGDGAAVGAWLWGIARRRLADLSRRRQHPMTTLEETPEIPAGNHGPEELAVSAEMTDRLRRAVGRLRPEQQAVLTAVVDEGRSVEETAQVMGIPVGTVKSRLHRARQQLREELQ